ncbi:MAG: VWA domain-containing protein [Chlamydiota bacterium]|nr:VWA domain-containing protein [Chlamydiota bacterium]
MSGLYIDTTASLTLLIAFIIAFFLWVFFKKWSKPYFNISSLSLLILAEKTWRERFASLPRYLLLATILMFSIAYTDPHRFTSKADTDTDNQDTKRIATEGIAIYLVLDNSLSMSEELSLPTPSGRRKTTTKIDVLKEMTKQFVNGSSKVGLAGRKNDLIGIVSFARGAQVLSPLTLDHDDINQKLEEFAVNRDESQLGTALGYAIFKTANLIEATRHFNQASSKDSDPAYQIKNSVIVLVTDGFQETNPEDYANPLRSVDLVDAVEYAQTLGIRLYIINIDPKITSTKYSDHRKFFKLLTQMTGGNFFYVDSTRDLSNIYSEIDQLEKSTLPDHSQKEMEKMPHIYRRMSYYRIFIAIGMFFFAMFVVLQTTVFRRVP